MDNHSPMFISDEAIKIRLREFGIAYWEEDGEVLYKADINVIECIH